MIHAFFSCLSKWGTDFFGICYQPHADSPLETKVRMKFRDGEKDVYAVLTESPEKPADFFCGLLKELIASGAVKDCDGEVEVEATIAG